MSEGAASSYREAGVDLDVAEQVVEKLKPLAAATRTPGVESGLGAFGGFFSFPEPGGRQLLVASIDGVGTKMKVARLTGNWQGAGYDIVAHCTNDILVHGARPLFFLDYIGTSKLELGVLEELGRGMAQACREAGCALLGGETAEMPGVYHAGEVDLVGCMVGSVARDRLISGERVAAGDLVVGLASAGLHTNGYSLARRVLLENGPGIDGEVPGSPERIGAALAAPHRMYLGAVREYLPRPELHAMAHVTGGGIPGNVARVIPEGLCAEIRKGAWEVPALFRLIQERGAVSEGEMYRVFNMGVGWLLIVDPGVAGSWQAELGGAGWEAHLIGEIRPGSDRVRLVS
jgi:phosphoribosylformylglycinamidine cyclo-ligase